MEPLQGVYPAIVTPFTEAGALDLKALEKVLEMQLSAGVDGFYVGGSTGEGILQDIATRRTMMRFVADRVRGKAKVIVHVAACATEDAVTLAREAASAGADAVSALPPIFYKVGFDAVERYYRTIAEATDLPLLAYYIPALSGWTFSAAEMARLLAIPGVGGLKFSDYNLFLLHGLREHHPQATVLSGNDEVFLPALVMGAHGSIGLTLNFMPRLYVGIYRAYRAGNLTEAQRLQFQANRITEIVLRYGALAACKAALKMLGIDCGPCRGPILSLTDGASDALRRELEAAGFFAPEWA
jgi:N-acetylneuraminate lyase